VSKDDNGHGLLHKAVALGHKDMVRWLVEKFPETAEVKDWVSEARITFLHLSHYIHTKCILVGINVCTYMSQLGCIYTLEIINVCTQF
jgi:hypothetical protein